MSKDIKKYIGTCDICRKTKPRRHTPVGMLQLIPIPSQPFEIVTMYFIPELPECEGYDNILVIVDKLIKDTWWWGDFRKEICDEMGMKRALTTAYHPQADGQMEIMNQTLEISSPAYVGPNRDNWVFSLNGSLSYNSTPHTATGFAPAYLLRGYVLVTTVQEAQRQRLCSAM